MHVFVLQLKRQWYFMFYNNSYITMLIVVLIKFEDYFGGGGGDPSVPPPIYIPAHICIIAVWVSNILSDDGCLWTDTSIMRHAVQK